jgi:hypothetical protein
MEGPTFPTLTQIQGGQVGVPERWHGRSPALRLHQAREARRLGGSEETPTIDDTFGINHLRTGTHQGCQTGLCTRASAVERLLDGFTGTSARHSITQIQGWARWENGEPHPQRGPNVTAVSPRGGDGDPPREGRSPDFAVVLLILSLTLLLMGFSVCAVLLNQTALAAMAGTTAVGLVGETVRRVLKPR